MFANAKFFYLFIAVPIIVLIFIIDILSQRKRAKQLAGRNVADILPFYSESQKWIRIIFYTLGLVLSIVALARPRWGYETIESNVKGRDVMIVLDTSYSMATGDVAPTRLDSAKRSIVEMLNMSTGDRVGLMVFSGSCELLAPVTHDYAAVEFFLESVYPGMLSKVGTNIGDAIMTAIDAFDDADARSKMILLMTDGEDLDGPYYRMLKKAKESGIKIFTVGIGSGNGEPIPLRNAKGEIESYVKDENGKHVISRLNESRLIEIAETSGGSYMKSTNSKGELRRFIESINSIESKEQADLKYEQMKEHYDIFLIPALLCFAIGFILDQGRILRKKSNRFGWLGSTKMLWFAVILLLGLGMFNPAQTFAQESDASDDTQNVQPKKLMENMNGGFWGNRAFRKGDYDKALADYSRAVNKLKGNDLAKLYYNMANAYFMKEDYDKAAEYYENSSWFAKDSELRAKIAYNNGLNAFKQKKFDEAMVDFKQSLAEDDSNDDARYNYQICRKLLEMAQQQQQNQQNQQNQKQQQQSETEQQQGSQAEESEEQNEQNEEKSAQQAEQRKPTREEMQQMLDALDNKERDEQKNKMKENKKNQKGKYW